MGLAAYGPLHAPALLLNLCPHPHVRPCLPRPLRDAAPPRAAPGFLSPRSASDAYLGLLGPIIRAEVGDTIQVVFKNSLRFPATMHPHGVAYLKNSEGSPYFDGTMGGWHAADARDAVPGCPA